MATWEAQRSDESPSQTTLKSYGFTVHAYLRWSTPPPYQLRLVLRTLSNSKFQIARPPLFSAASPSRHCFHLYTSRSSFSVLASSTSTFGTTKGYDF
ncbi:hypothetical protein K1719_019924 [Acacia pycnantha]|nr:hypothetical protein K1719_019924 [Acacia pycnantha]